MTERDKSTGRYKHTWGWIHHDEQTHREYAECQDCGRIHAYGGEKADKFYKNLFFAKLREPELKAGLEMLGVNHP
jgi:hypothetical protein